MAKLLIHYPQQAGLRANADPNQPRNQCSSESYRVDLNKEVLIEILQNFAGISELIPVLSLGNSLSGRASTLEAFLGEGNEGSFSSEDKPPGVYVWTRPVPLQDMSLLLMKMWGVDFLNERDKELETLNKKVMIALMSISSVCLFCGEKSSMFQSLTAIYELYAPIKERLHLEVSRFIVFADREAALANSVIKRKREIFNSRGFENPPAVLYRGSDRISATCKESLLQIVGSLQNHKVYLDSHRRTMKAIYTPDTIYALVTILTTILEMSRMDFDFGYFIDKLPNFTSPISRAEMRCLSEMEEFSRLVLSGTALEFFDETTIASRSYKIRESVISTLHANYKTDKPIIVMPIFGNPDTGKSTLLNHIVKYLLSCSEIPQLFKMGITPGHVTRGSQVLSNPLKLGENQLMLVDLEGLEGVETINEREAILQENLISNILKIASVPCILVCNKVGYMDFVERIIKKLSKLNNDFGYKIERVHLLFHDKDLGADIQPAIEDQIKIMNRKYFAGERILKQRNKPNFIDESKTEMCKDFLRELMEDCNFSKRKASGSPVLLKQLLLEMRYITEYNLTDMSEIRLTYRELQACNEYAHVKSPLLLQIFERVKGDETNGSLESAFDVESHQLLSMCNEELWVMKVKWTRRALAMLETEADSHREKIKEIQCFHKMIANLTQNNLWLVIETQLDNLRHKYQSFGSFKIVASAMKKILVTEKERYPRDLHRMDQIIQKFENKLSILKHCNYQTYGFQAGGILASGGVGFLATEAVMAINAVRVGYASIAGGGVGAGSFFGYLASKIIDVEGDVIELFNIEKPGWLSSRKNASTMLNSKVIKILEENPCPVMVFLVIAAKKIKASIMLNELIRQIIPISSSQLAAFNDSKLTQILYSGYQDRKTFIIYLKMEEDKTGAEYKAVETIAVSLIQKASFTCLFLDSPEEYARDIITKAFPPANPEEVKHQLNSRVAAIYPENRRDTCFLADLRAREMQNVQISMSDFSDESLNLMVVDVKEAFVESTPIESQALMEVLRDAEQAANAL